MPARRQQTFAASTAVGAPSAPDLSAAVATLKAEGSKGTARGLVAAVLGALWSARAGGLPIAPGPAAPVTDTALATRAAQVAAQWAALPTAQAGQAIGGLYAELMPAEERARHGVYYTPPTLAERLVDQAGTAGVDWRTARVLDPAAGGAALLIPVARRMAAALDGTEPALALHSIAARLSGWELDPFAAWIGNVLLELELLDLVRASGRRLPPPITAGDSLERAEEPAFDLVIGNPPYGRVTLPEALRARFGRSLHGHANLYGVFMDLAVRLARPGGLVSFLTPASFLAGEYFKNLRATLATHAPPSAIDFVDQRKDVFEGVLQETVLATYRRGRRTKAAVTILQARPEGAPTLVPAGAFALPAAPTAPWILPRHPEDVALAARLRAMPTRLADWGYRVSTGPLVWNRHKPQLLTKPVKGCVPVVWAESITADGRFEWRHEKANHRPWFKPEDGDAWLIVRRPCVLLQRTTAKEQARRLIAAEMPAAFVRRHGGVTVENHVNMLVPLTDRPAVSPSVLAAFLNTRAADRAFRCLSGSVAVSASELEALPLPPVSDLREFNFLVAAGAGRGHLGNAAGIPYGIEEYDASSDP